MPSSVRVHVTEEDLAKAERGNSNRCMIAQAVKRDLGASRVIVDTQTIRYTRDGKRYVHLTPPRLQQMIADFDAGITPEPFDGRIGSPIQVVPAGRNKTKPRQTRVETRRMKHRDNPAVIGVTIAGGRLPPRPGRVGRRNTRQFGMRQLRVNGGTENRT